MSFKVLVIPEDPTHNGYILKPLVEAILADAGKPNAKVRVLTNPHLNGYDDAVQAIRNNLETKYSFCNLWLFMPDADRATPGSMAALEEDLHQKGVRLFCCPAQSEVEIYACAAYRDQCELPWNALRQHPRIKEDIFERIRTTYGNINSAGGGRTNLITEALKNLPLLFNLCPELKELRDRIAALV